MREKYRDAEEHARDCLKDCFHPSTYTSTSSSTGNRSFDSELVSSENALAYRLGQASSAAHALLCTHQSRLRESAGFFRAGRVFTEPVSNIEALNDMKIEEYFGRLLAEVAESSPIVRSQCPINRETVD